MPFSTKHPSARDHQHSCDSLTLEVLEDRMMLSTVEIFAAGATGEENLELFVDGQFERTFSKVGGDASSRQFQRFVFETDQTLTPGNIGIGFANDAFNPSIGLDRDLIVDRIVVDGVSVEAEDPSTFSTGIYRDGLTGAGFFETEVLNINGILTFADPPSSGGSNGDRIEFDASGTTGDELVQLLINGQVVETFGFFNGPGVTQTFTFNSDDPSVSIEDIRLEFVNDFFDPSTGTDRNVLISEFRVIDGDTGQVQTARTTDANVLNSGIFADGAIAQGFGAGGFLVGNFDGNAFVEISGGNSTGNGDRIEFDAVGTTGDELVQLFVNGQVVETFGFFDGPGVTSTFTFNSDDSNVSIDDIRLEFINDFFDPTTGTDRNVQIFEYRVVDGDTGQVQTARTSDANVLSSGIFANGAITQGFGAGGFLTGNFDGNAFVEISSDGGGGGGSFSIDPSFQATLGLNGSSAAIGPSDQIAVVTPDENDRPLSPIPAVSNEFSEVTVFGIDGVPLSGFGNNGSVDLADILDLDQLVLDSGFSPTTTPNINITDLAYFDDGSLLVTGNILPSFFPSAGSTLIVKLNPDGTLDSSFAQQGVLQGSSIDLGPLNPEVQAAIDPAGRVLLFGVSTEAFGITDFAITRLNADGSIDSTFGDNGSVSILGSNFDFAIAEIGTIEFLDVSDNGEIVFAANLPTDSGDDSRPGSSLTIGRLLDDGSVDSGFGNNGFVVRDGGGLVRLTPDGGVVVAFDTPVPLFPDGTPRPLGQSTNIPTLLFLDSTGTATSEVSITPNTDLSGVVGANLDDVFNGVEVRDLAVDQSGNIVLAYARRLGFRSLPQVFVQLDPSGVVESEVITPGVGSDGLVFDSNGRLVQAEFDVVRFEFV